MRHRELIVLLSKQQTPDWQFELRHSALYEQHCGDALPNHSVFDRKLSVMWVKSGTTRTPIAYSDKHHVHGN